MCIKIWIKCQKHLWFKPTQWPKTINQPTVSLCSPPMLSTCIRKQWGCPEASCRPVGWSWWRKEACRHHPLISCWAKSLWSEILPHHCPSVQLPTTHILSFISQTAICLPWHTSTWLQSICVLITTHQRNNIWSKGRPEQGQPVSFHGLWNIGQMWVCVIGATGILGWIME